MRNQKGFIIIPLIILALVAIGAAIFVTKTIKVGPPVSYVSTTQKESITENPVQTDSCGKANFTNALTDINSIDHISSGAGVGDARFTYLWLKAGQKVPVYAPADGTLVYIAYKTRSDLDPNMSSPDYDIAFTADCHTLYRINHITNPIPEIVSESPITTPMELKPGSGVNDNDTKPKQNIKVKAGDKLGETTGTPKANNFDFGVFVDNAATCPYEKFTDPIKSSWLKLFNGSSCVVNGNY